MSDYEPMSECSSCGCKFERFSSDICDYCLCIWENEVESLIQQNIIRQEESDDPDHQTPR